VAQKRVACGGRSASLSATPATLLKNPFQKVIPHNMESILQIIIMK
jgi:hypothetical protein